MNINNYTHYSGFVFDLDGVLADTEPLCFQAIQDIFADRFRLTDEDYHNVLGIDYLDTALYLIDRYNLEDDPQTIMAQQKVNSLRRIDRDLTPNPGVIDLLTFLHRQRVPLAVASNSPRDYVQHALVKLEVRDFFGGVISRDDVTEGKPDPEPYLTACRAIGIRPETAMAIEDSLVGAESAWRAGMSVVLVQPQPPQSNPCPSQLVWEPDFFHLHAALIRDHRA